MLEVSLGRDAAGAVPKAASHQQHSTGFPSLG